MSIHSTPLKTSLVIVDLIFRLRNIRREVLFTPAQRGHETNAVALLHHSGPTVLIDITPAGEMARRTSLQITLRRENKELHSRAVVPPGNSFMRSISFITKMAAITLTAMPMASTAGFCSACFQVRFGAAT